MCKTGGRNIFIFLIVYLTGSSSKYEDSGVFVQVEMQVPWVPKEKPCQETEFSLNSFSLSMNIIRKATNKRKEHPKIAFS